MSGLASDIAKPTLAGCGRNSENWLSHKFVRAGYGRQRPDWLADDAVSCEPVSGPNSLLTGKLTGNFAESGLLLQFQPPVSELIQRLAAKFPTQRNREFLDAYQGKFFEEQGICILISGRTWIARQTTQ
jgi:hypothetical protein